MKKEIADKWVEALRSNTYKQTHGYLRAGDGYCCLGVLCELVGVSGVETDNRSPTAKVYVYDFETCVLPPSAMLLSGIRSEVGLYNTEDDVEYIHHTQQLSLAEMNDNGSTFEEIAKVIEEKWAEL